MTTRCPQGGPQGGPQVVPQRFPRAPRPGGTILLPLADCLNHSPWNSNCEVLQHADAIEVATRPWTAAAVEHVEKNWASRW